MFKQKINLGFTLVELVVVITILAILSTVWFVYFSDNITSARDSKRLTDISTIETALRSYKQKRGSLPLPWNSFNILNSWSWVAIQWKLDKNVRLSTLDTLPVDPKLNIWYSYSITAKKQEFELGATFEAQEPPKAIVSWDYKSVSKNVLPSILLAHDSWDIEINSGSTLWAENRKLFIFNEVIYNLPYTFDWTGEPYSQWVDFDDLILKAEENNYWQNSDFMSCEEIYNANKSIWDWQYQYINGWALEDINCIMSAF